MTIENNILEKFGDALLTIIKQYPYLLVATSILLFCPISILTLIGLGDLKTDYVVPIGVTFILCLSIGLVDIFKWTRLKLITQRRWKRHLNELTIDEKKFLKDFITEDLNTKYDWPGNGVVASLARKGIIYQASSVSMDGGDFGYNLQPWARSILIKNQKLFETVDNHE